MTLGAGTVEIAWLVVVILVVIVAVMLMLWLGARSKAGKARAELEQAVKRAEDLQLGLDAAEKERRTAADEAAGLAARLKDSRTDRDKGGFDAERIYRLLAKSTLESNDGQRTYGVVQEDSGSIRPFMVGDLLDHIETGDCFGILRGKAAKIDEREFEAAAGQPEPEGGRAPVTEMRASARAEAEAAAATGYASQKTAIYVAPKVEQPEDPNKGLPYLVIEDGDEDGEVHHLAFGRMTAGRGPDNNIVLQDQAASRVHFVVSFTGHRFQVEDNNSTNGTQCNGEAVSKKWLEFGDRIQVGDTTMRFSCEGYDRKDDDPKRAVEALEECVARQSDFIDALKLLAFMLERNVARKKEAASYWDTIARLEKSS